MSDPTIQNFLLFYLGLACLVFGATSWVIDVVSLFVRVNQRPPFGATVVLITLGLLAIKASRLP